MKLSRAEQETIIRKAADEDHWHVFSEDPKFIAWIKKNWKAYEEQDHGAWFRIPTSQFSFQKKRSGPKKALSEEHRRRLQEGRARARAARTKKPGP